MSYIHTSRSTCSSLLPLQYRNLRVAKLYRITLRLIILRTVLIQQGQGCESHPKNLLQHLHTTLTVTAAVYISNSGSME